MNVIEYMKSAILRPRTSNIIELADPKADRDPYILNEITVKPISRKSADIDTWRSSIKSADNGRVVALYDLLDDMLLDGVLSDALSKRINAVNNAELNFMGEDGKPVDEINDLMKSLQWEELLKGIMNRQAYGRAALEVTFNDGFRVAQIPAKHIDLKNKKILYDQNEEKGYNYENDKHIIVLGKDRDYGWLIIAAQYVIYKRGGFGDWAQWVELFGMPQRIGKYSSHDPKSRELLEEALDKAGSAPILIVPKETDIETRDNGSTSGAQYNEFRQACNEEILITINGQTLTTVQGANGARSLGEVHKEVEEAKHIADLRYVEKVLNTYLLPLLEARGFKTAGGKFVFPKAAEKISVQELVMLSDIVDIPQRYIYERYCIPAVQEGEKIARRQQPQMPDYGIEGDIKNSDKGKDFFLLALSDKEERALNGTAHTKKATNVPAVNEIIRRVHKGLVETFDRSVFEFCYNNLRTAFKRGYYGKIKNTDVNLKYNQQDDAFITAMEQNLYRFSAAKTFAEVQALNAALRSSNSYKEFEEQASKICQQFNEEWQRTEHDTAVLAAESASNYQRLVKQKNTFPLWKYRIVDDGSTRPEHKALEGLVLPAIDPLWDKIFPPNGWNCRCWIEPILRHEADNENFEVNREKVKKYMTSDDWDNAQKQGWGTNRGKRSLIFEENNFYVQRFAQQEVKLASQITASEWGIEPDYNNLIKQSKEVVKVYEGDPQDYWQKNKVTSPQGKETIPLKDYAGRTWYMDEKGYTAHTTDKVKNRAFRTKYLNVIKDVASNPDEVWLGEELKDKNNPESRLNNWIMIKYYNDVALACICKLEGDVMTFKSWYELRNEQVRKGLLLRSRRIK